MIRVTLPDKSVREFPKALSVAEVAASIGPGLAKSAVAGRINGETVDIRTVIEKDCALEIITIQKPESREIVRHSAAHIMAQAIQKIWPEVKITIGPVIDSGFFYDLDSPRAFIPEDLQKIEIEMQRIVDADFEIKKEVWPVQKAIDTFKKMGERFKVEIIEDLKKNEGVTEVSIYHQGDWFDLCRGPHVPKTGFLKAFKLLSIAGAYWRGDEKNPQLQRIYGTAFENKKELDAYLTQIEESKKRDHRKLGKDLDLFVFHPWAPASPFFLPKGTIIYNELQKFLRELYFEFGYTEVVTPQVFDVKTFITSGHYANYRENMYVALPASNLADSKLQTIKLQEEQNADGKVTELKILSQEGDGSESAQMMKAMNCPGHAMMFGAQKHSYRDLPWRVADFGRLHRYERAGVVHGLARVRTFCQDDGHIFCAMEQLQSEISGFIDLLNRVYKTLGFEKYEVLLSTRPEKRMGADELWDTAEGALEQALKNLNLKYRINAGDGAFYGPKLDVMVTDAIGRPWQLGTVQVDFNMANNFGLEFTGEDNKPHKPVVLHRAVLGSFERFIGVLIEHCEGRFPTWLSPKQVAIINITTSQEEYAKELMTTLRKLGIRAEADIRNEKLGYKIREAQLQKVPYMLILGDQEMNTKTVSVRTGKGKEIKQVSVDDFVKKLTAEIESRSLTGVFDSIV